VQETIDKAVQPKPVEAPEGGGASLLGFFSGGGRRSSRGGAEDGGGRRNSTGGLGGSSDADVSKLEALLDIAKQCQAMSAESFRAECETLVFKLDEGRKSLPVGPAKRLHTRLLFILTRCTRLLQFQKEGFAIDRDLSAATWGAPGGGNNGGKKSWPVADPKLDRAWTARSPERRGVGGEQGKRLQGAGSLPVGTDIPPEWLAPPTGKRAHLERIESGLSDWSEGLEVSGDGQGEPKGAVQDEGEPAKAEPFGLVQKVTSWRAAAMRAGARDDVIGGRAPPAASGRADDVTSPGGRGARDDVISPSAALPPLAKSPSIKKPNEQLRVSIPSAASGDEPAESPPLSRESSGVRVRTQMHRVSSEPALASLQSVGSDQSQARASSKVGLHLFLLESSSCVSSSLC
jgi:hypothetical protein